MHIYLSVSHLHLTPHILIETDLCFWSSKVPLPSHCPSLQALRAITQAWSKEQHSYSKVISNELSWQAAQIHSNLLCPSGHLPFRNLPRHQNKCSVITSSFFSPEEPSWVQNVCLLFYYGADQWCSLAFCSEYTVYTEYIFPLPASYAPIPEPDPTPHGTTTLTNA